MVLSYLHSGATYYACVILSEVESVSGAGMMHLVYVRLHSACYMNL